MSSQYGRDISGKAFKMPAEPWWDNFDENVQKESFPYEANLVSSMLVYLAWALDFFILLLVGLLFLSIPLGYVVAWLGSRIGLGNLWEILSNNTKNAVFYQKLINEKSIQEIFVEPPKNIAIVESERKPLPFISDVGFVTDLSFVSPFVTLNPALRETYTYYKNNGTAYAQYWQHNDGPRPTVCIVHGFLMSSYGINSRLFDAKSLFEHGYNVLFYTQPFHNKKRPAYPPVSGAHFIMGSNICNEAFAHSIFDFRIFINHLEAMGVKELGVTGISLGGQLSALLASVEPRLQFSAPWLPTANLADNLTRWPGLGLYLRTQHKLGGETLSQIRHTLALTSPLSYQPLLDNERLRIFAGIGDRFVSPQIVQLLAHHWGDCVVRWNRHGHLSPRASTHSKEFFEFLESIQFGHTLLPARKALG
ncbi:MAG: hypothetical protein COA99_11590 [Moraxellaceae bacterium]|nr:MAG: hypothetical protein COA99_11590 [Moraxellaceae bacterium]